LNGVQTAWRMGSAGFTASSAAPWYVCVLNGYGGPYSSPSYKHCCYHMGSSSACLPLLHITAVVAAFNYGGCSCCWHEHGPWNAFIPAGSSGNLFRCLASRSSASLPLFFRYCGTRAYGFSTWLPFTLAFVLLKADETAWILASTLSAWCFCKHYLFFLARLLITGRELTCYLAVLPILLLPTVNHALYHGSHLGRFFAFGAFGRACRGAHRTYCPLPRAATPSAGWNVFLIHRTSFIFSLLRTWFLTWAVETLLPLPGAAGRFYHTTLHLFCLHWISAQPPHGCALEFWGMDEVSGFATPPGRQTLPALLQPCPTLLTTA